MSRDTSSIGIVRRNGLRNIRSERNENEFENPTDSIPFLPPRTPLNSIPDPSQYTRGIEEYDPDSIPKFESSKIGAFDYPLALSNGITNTGLNSATHRISARGKAQSEPNSAQSTPAKSVPKVSNNTALGACTSTRTPQYTGARGGTSSRVPRGISIVPFASYTELPYFEIVEDPAFWLDHNVQVLIRIRPLNTTEKALQGYGRCLRQDSAQSLTWLGHPETRFTFDHIACETISQEELFKVVGLPMVENCMSGYNSCMFAYGQTGSGKTYTMMGEIFKMDGKLNEYCGLTPRIFENLFLRIRAEEENRRDEKLKYSCKCSFLEIYNEQITDLLEPSSTNLQLREDLKKGVYVENLTEHEATTVRDVVELLLQGAANRKMAATNMNSESSRSHSVFTCVIESRWDKDSMNHLRFGRLNMVDLAGSERQKSSGAEGERLKEAANINKSLSILGLVIMTLVDVAQGKHRHIPYRDSRLTFLLQDSLGGNSKTTIIANVSPSICSANETLSTLKFAQRAKLIQNNAKVNEDASGDVVALQREIQQLKGQLTILLKHHNLSRSPLLSCPRSEQSKSGDCHEECDSYLEGRPLDDMNNTGVSERKIKCLEAALVGALRREKMAEDAARKLEAEIEHMNCLVHQKEEDAQCSKMMLRLRGEKIKRLELLAEGLVSGDQYLMEENSALSKEIQSLQARIDRNPELTRFALENMRLLDQLRVLQDFYKQGERETLLAEVSEMRDQICALLEALVRHHEPLELCQRTVVQDTDILRELEECRKNLSASIKCNTELTRKVDELQRELKEYLECNKAASHSVADSLCGEDPVKHTNKYSTVDTISETSDSEYEIASNYQVVDESIGLQKDQEFGDVLAWASTVTQKELGDEGSLMETMKSEQLQLVEELDILQQGHSQYMELLKNKDSEDIKFPLQVGTECGLLEGCWKTELGDQVTGLMTEGISGFTRLVQRDKFDRMQRELEEARILNRCCQDNQESQLSNQHEAEQIQKQVEMETAETILHLQEELATLEHRLCSLTQENTRLRNSIASREDSIKALSEEWEKATLDLTNFLLEGCKSLEDASNHVESISMSFPQRIISEQAQRAARVFAEKEKTILCLENSLEEAQKIGLEMKLKLSSLNWATLAITEVQQLENDQSTKEANQLRRLLNDKNSLIQELEKQLKDIEKQLMEAVKRADAAFIVVKRLLDFQSDAHKNGSGQEIHELIWAIPTQGDKSMVPEMKDKANVQALETLEVQIEMTRQRVLKAESAIHGSYIDTQMHLSSLPSEILETSTIFMQLIQDLAEEICAMKKNFEELKEQNRVAGSYMTVPPSLVACGSQMLENKYHIIKEIKDELGQTNKALNTLNTGIGKLFNVGRVGDLPATDASIIDSFQLSSDPSTSRIAFMGELDETSVSNSCCVCPVEFTGFECDSISERDVSFMLHKGKLRDFQKPIENLICDDATIQSLRKDLQLVFNSFLEIQVHLATLFNDKEIACCPNVQGRCFHESVAIGNNNHFHTDQKVHDKLGVMQMGQQIQSFEEDAVNCSKNKEVLHFKISNPRLVIEEGNRVNSFLNKCEEAQATMKEADAMLNALLKAKETAKHMTDEWKQAGETWVIERASLVEEVQQLKASLYLKEEEYEFMKEQICSSLEEVTSSLSFLEGSFFQMQRDVEDWFKVIFCDIFSMRRDIWDHLHNSRSSLEDIWSSMMENDFALFVLYQCYVGKHYEKIPRFKADLGLSLYTQRECCSTLNNLGTKCLNAGENGPVVKGMFHLEGMLGQSQNKNPQEELSKPENTKNANYFSRTFAKLKEDELSKSFDSLIFENLSLKKELSRKDVILKGLLFDLSLLQESAASANDKKAEMEQNVAALDPVRHELAVKTTQLDDILIQHQKLRAELDDRVAALSISNSELEQAQATVYTLSNQNTELRHLLEDIYARKNSAEQQLEETNEVVKCLEKEIIRLASSVEEKILNSIVDIEKDLRRVTAERDCLYEEVISLNGKLEMANALAEENEAIAIEARQESEASKIYAEQKEEEVKILERSVGELECTVDVLEKKVYEMSKEVERHHRMRDNLEQELQALRQRLSTVETAAENVDSGNSNVEDQEEDQTSKHIDNGILKRIRFLEMEKADQAEEIKRCKEYISELVLHAEAQATQYQQKYKALEDMVREVQSDPSSSTSAALTLDKNEKTATRARGSSSPFRCIASLVQQMNSEKDRELSMAKLRIEELGALAAKRHKEVCMLNARLSAAENMTHDVIRDLLGVKLDITNYANLIDQDQIQKLLEEAHRQTEESLAMEKEILKLQKKIDDLTTERESCIEEINRREADILATQLTVEQLQQRDQLLAAQNEMLQRENTSLKRKSADLDEMLKKVLGSQNVQRIQQQPPKIMEQNPGRVGNRELSKRLAHSQKLLSRVNDELSWYCKSESSSTNSKGKEEQRHRNKRQESEG